MLTEIATKIVTRRRSKLMPWREQEALFQAKHVDVNKQMSNWAEMGAFIIPRLGGHCANFCQTFNAIEVDDEEFLYGFEVHFDLQGEHLFCS
jgi:hypothetical protein